jgi:cell shape-determining protein MreC
VNPRWNLGLLAVLLLGHLVLLSTDPSSRGSTLESLVLATVAPVAHAATAARDGVAGVFESLRIGRSLRAENRLLKEELDRASCLRSVVVYTGWAAPRRNQPVITAKGLVGRVIVAAQPYAKILLLTDRSASVSAMIERTRRRGIVWGSGEQSLMLDNIPSQESVRAGDRVVTAGIDGVFPRGIPIGEVSEVKAGPELFHHIQVKPAIDLATLAHVFVLTEEVVPRDIRDASPEGGPEP